MSSKSKKQLKVVKKPAVKKPAVKKPQSKKAPKKDDDRFKIARQGELKHAIGGKKFYYLKYDGDYTIDEIKKYAQQKSNELKKDGRIQRIQVSVLYSNEGDRSGKMTETGEPIDVKDLKQQYDHDIGDIVGFYIYLQ